MIIIATIAVVVVVVVVVYGNFFIGEGCGRVNGQNYFNSD